MSMTNDGLFISCDGENCTAVTRIPVAKSRFLLSRLRASDRDGRNWLFVTHADCQKHYCPACGAKFIPSMEAVDLACRVDR